MAAEVSNRFVRARVARSTEIAEDYVELIGDLIADSGEARAVDIARALGVKQATVSNVVARLARDGFVTSQPYRSIFLTEKGERLARMSRQRHAIVQNFLVAIGVPPPTAAIDAEGMEHHVSAETLAILEQFTTKLQKR
ncbi:MAG: manganese-binding transcriptional regulator MntR [Candidatus Eremiobacteraeota bacterium]|nr:manganese-binding transcriptional regulator MntR [Candidatus Eremiobacteraeota bacterium]MBC5803329.1 manganese-binding transcriptional regulator MntR [Candidatus Eremiobacteraeota bacterium]MBC5822851.1 manganese-binding transcriptional regulator MntR [Candidatus Eremiobacteraeota bacterium]